MTDSEMRVTVVGAGLAGTEAAWQAAEHGAQVVLYEMRPVRSTAAHQTGDMAELVCSNSLGSNLPDRALGVLKNEMRRLGSLIIRCADACAVPAGGALAVDREEFSRAVTAAIEEHPRITVRREEVTDLASLLAAERAQSATVIATGPLTSPALAQGIRELAGENYLYFFDAMAPIVSAETVDMTIAFRQSRYDKSTRPQPGETAVLLSDAEAEGDYINCPLSKDEYFAFVEAVNAADKISLREF